MLFWQIRAGVRAGGGSVPARIRGESGGVRRSQGPPLCYFFGSVPFASLRLSSARHFARKRRRLDEYSALFEESVLRTHQLPDNFLLTRLAEQSAEELVDTLRTAGRLPQSPGPRFWTEAAFAEAGFTSVWTQREVVQVLHVFGAAHVQLEERQRLRTTHQGHQLENQEAGNQEEKHDEEKQFFTRRRSSKQEDAFLTDRGDAEYAAYQQASLLLFTRISPRICPADLSITEIVTLLLSFARRGVRGMRAPMRLCAQLWKNDAALTPRAVSTASRACTELGLFNDLLRDRATAHLMKHSYSHKDLFDLLRAFHDFRRPLPCYDVCVRVCGQVQRNLQLFNTQQIISLFEALTKIQALQPDLLGAFQQSLASDLRRLTPSELVRLLRSMSRHDAVQIERFALADHAAKLACNAEHRFRSASLPPLTDTTGSGTGGRMVELLGVRYAVSGTVSAAFYKGVAAAASTRAELFSAKELAQVLTYMTNAGYRELALESKCFSLIRLKVADLSADEKADLFTEDIPRYLAGVLLRALFVPDGTSEFGATRVELAGTECSGAHTRHWLGGGGPGTPRSTGGSESDRLTPSQFVHVFYILTRVRYENGIVFLIQHVYRHLSAVNSVVLLGIQKLLADLYPSAADYAAVLHRALRHRVEDPRVTDPPSSSACRPSAWCGETSLRSDLCSAHSTPPTPKQEWAPASECIPHSVPQVSPSRYRPAAEAFSLALGTGRTPTFHLEGSGGLGEVPVDTAAAVAAPEEAAVKIARASGGVVKTKEGEQFATLGRLRIQGGSRTVAPPTTIFHLQGKVTALPAAHHELPPLWVRHRKRVVGPVNSQEPHKASSSFTDGRDGKDLVGLTVAADRVNVPGASDLCEEAPPVFPKVAQAVVKSELRTYERVTSRISIPANAYVKALWQFSSRTGNSVDKGKIYTDDWLRLLHTDDQRPLLLQDVSGCILPFLVVLLATRLAEPGDASAELVGVVGSLFCASVRRVDDDPTLLGEMNWTGLGMCAGAALRVLATSRSQGKLNLGPQRAAQSLPDQVESAAQLSRRTCTEVVSRLMSSNERMESVGDVEQGVNLSSPYHPVPVGPSLCRVSGRVLQCFEYLKEKPPYELIQWAARGARRLPAEELVALCRALVPSKCGVLRKQERIALSAAFEAQKPKMVWEDYITLQELGKKLGVDEYETLTSHPQDDRKHTVGR